MSANQSPETTAAAMATEVQLRSAMNKYGDRLVAVLEIARWCSGLRSQSAPNIGEPRRLAGYSTIHENARQHRSGHVDREPSMMRSPDGLEWMQQSQEGREWLDRLPTLLAEVTEQWSLRTEDPYPDAFGSLAMPAMLADGTDAVLKLAFPHRESRYEAEALLAWNGNGAVLLFAHDPARNALLLERCTPGSPLSDVDADLALSVFIDLLPRLWKPAGPPFTPLSDEAAWWASYLEHRWERAGRPFSRALLDAAVDALHTLPGTQSEQVLVNQDLHAGNVLRAQRERWLVIDPKPLAGEREFGVASIIRGRELGHSRDAVLTRLTRLSTELGLDYERARRWTLAQTLAWSFDGGTVLAGHVEVAQWLHEAQ